MEESMEYLERALNSCNTVPSDLSKAIAITKRHADTCKKISWWKEGLWEMLEEFLNTHPEGIDEELFIQGCALLGE